MAVALSFIAFREEPLPSPAEIVQALANNWPDLPAATELSQSENTVAFRMGSANVALGVMPAPLPWNDLEGPCATSLLWPSAADDLRSHQAHIIVTVISDLAPIAKATLLTQVTAAVMAATPYALGVYWADATLIVPKDVFVAFATEILPKGPPLHIWVDFRAGKNADQTCSGFTTGMEALGHMELETENATESPGELRKRFMSLAAYVIESGPVIKDGDTIGESASERIRVRYSKSSFGHEKPVMRLEYEGGALPSKPWWKMW